MWSLEKDECYIDDKEAVIIKRLAEINSVTVEVMIRSIDEKLPL